MRSFLASGGRLLLLVDPVFESGTGSLLETGLEPLVSEWGLRLGRDVVIDPVSPLPFFGPDTIFTNRMRGHAITRGLEAGCRRSRA